MANIQLEDIERRIADMQAAYQRQIAISGKRYDHILMESLKRPGLASRSKKSHAPRRTYRIW